MTHQHEVRASPAGQHVGAVAPGRSLKFGNDNAFQLELRRRVDEHFRTTGRRQCDKYAQHESFRAGLASQFRWLRRMGMPNTA